MLFSFKRQAFSFSHSIPLCKLRSHPFVEVSHSFGALDVCIKNPKKSQARQKMLCAELLSQRLWMFKTNSRTWEVLLVLNIPSVTSILSDIDVKQASP